MPDYAEEYTRAERIRFVLWGVSIGAAVVLTCEVWLFPWFGEIASTANCRSLFGVSGVTVLWHFLFVGIPLSLVLIAACTLSFRGYKILRDGQVPYIGEKVFRPTLIERGNKSRLIGYIHIMAFLPFLAIALWGASQADELSKQGKVRPCLVK